MSWTNPKTWTAAVLSSIDFNTHIRDNLNVLKTSVDDSGHLRLPSFHTASADYTAVPSDDIVFCFASLTLTLYPQSTSPGRLLAVHTDPGNTGHVVIDPSGSETIEGQSTYTLPPGERVLLWAATDLSGWRVLFRTEPAVGPPRCLIYNNTTQTHTAGSGNWVALTFNSEEFNTGNMHNVGTNPTRITIPAGHGGYYMLGGAVSFAGGTYANGVRMRFRKNGGSLVGTITSADVGDSGYRVGLMNTQIVFTTAGDYYEVEVQHGAGGSPVFGAASPRDEQNQFWAYKISPAVS